MLAPQGNSAYLCCDVRIRHGWRSPKCAVRLELRPLIQRLNIFQPMFEPISAQIDFILRHRVEHERIIRIGRMAQGKDFSGILCHLEFVIQTVFAFGSYTKRCVTQFSHSRAS